MVSHTRKRPHATRNRRSASLGSEADLGDDTLDEEELAQHRQGQGKWIYIRLPHAAAQFVAKDADAGPALDAVDEVHGIRLCRSFNSDKIRRLVHRARN